MSRITDLACIVKDHSAVCESIFDSSELCHPRMKAWITMKIEI